MISNITVRHHYTSVITLSESWQGAGAWPLKSISGPRMGSSHSLPGSVVCTATLFGKMNWGDNIVWESSSAPLAYFFPLACFLDCISSCSETTPPSPHLLPFPCKGKATLGSGDAWDKLNNRKFMVSAHFDFWQFGMEHSKIQTFKNHDYTNMIHFHQGCGFWNRFHYVKLSSGSIPLWTYWISKSGGGPDTCVLTSPPGNSDAP